MVGGRGLVRDQVTKVGIKIFVPSGHMLGFVGFVCRFCCLLRLG